VDERCVIGNHVGSLVLVAAGGQGTDASVVHAGACCRISECVPRWPAWAGAAGDKGPWRQQAILGRTRWEADALRDIVRDYALETLADPDAVLVIDETGFLKQGKASCGVARQYTGSTGKVTNCQIGVFAAYVSRHGHAFIDRVLYLPKPRYLRHYAATATRRRNIS
jgi:SRSO17 transposase